MKTIIFSVLILICGAQLLLGSKLTWVELSKKVLELEAPDQKHFKLLDKLLNEEPKLKCHTDWEYELRYFCPLRDNYKNTVIKKLRLLSNKSLIDAATRDRVLAALKAMK